MNLRICIIAVTLVTAAAAGQQGTSTSLPDAPSAPTSKPVASQASTKDRADDLWWGAYGYLYRGSLACGAGAAYSSADNKPTVGCGFGITIFPMMVTEFGIMAPSQNRVNFTAYFSEDVTVPIPIPKPAVKLVHGHPILLTGYTRMFETGRNSFDYGVGFERHVSEDQTLQFELRDYWTFASPQQHNVMFRIVWITGVQD